MALNDSIFSSVQKAFADCEELSNETLYQEVANRAGLSPEDLSKKEVISNQHHNIVKRKIRWFQQTLKHMGLIRKVSRGVWSLTDAGRSKLQLHRIQSGYVMLAFSTDLGIALWADCATAIRRLDQPIHLVVTSPPYPLAHPRAYGNPAENEYVDFLCAAMEPIVSKLVPGGSIALNLGNDIFERGLPSRSIYRERLVIALHDRFGLHKMDEIPWVNRSKAPGPVQWASIKRTQLNCAWEPVYWFTNDPSLVRSDNRRVLEPHTERHAMLIANGGEKRGNAYSDGAHTKRAGRSFSHHTAGSIPKNVIEIGHAGASEKSYKKIARAAGLPAHGAPFPAKLVEFFVKFLTVEGDLVVDPFAGSLTVPLVAQSLGRRWIATEVIWEYLSGAALRFPDAVQYEDFSHAI